jgi:hypothetical protein
MGGQACVFYGAAEFSRDCDVAILAEPENYSRLTAALEELKAECIAVPPWDWEYLQRGHALHFRAKHPDAFNIRLDVMTTMRGCDPFPLLWERRTTLAGSGGDVYELLGLEDLILAKKTQRDKDWPMIRRLVDAHYAEFHSSPDEERIRFWLRESRTVPVLLEVGAAHPELLRQEVGGRPLLAAVLASDAVAVEAELQQEQAREMAMDRAYWEPLKRELEQLRQQRRENE